jgi:hypothetical protein
MLQEFDFNPHKDSKFIGARHPKNQVPALKRSPLNLFMTDEAEEKVPIGSYWWTEKKRGGPYLPEILSYSFK